MLTNAYAKWLAAMTSAVMALAVPTAALADCGGYGGGGTWGMNLEPNSITFTSVNDDRGMRLKNTGTLSWYVTGWSFGGNYSVHDPSDCLEIGSASTLAPNQICDFEIQPTAANGTQTNFVVTTSGSNGTLMDSTSLIGP
jgi:hypothetical protein